MNKKRSGRKPHQFIKKQPAREWHIVVLDQAPIRKKAAAECSKAMARLEKAKQEWGRFDREDRPAYARWVSATFGALLTTIRETKSKVQEREILIEEVEDEMLFGGRGGYAGAYQRVMRERQFPPGNPDPSRKGPPPPTEDESFDESDDEEANDLAEEMLFEQFCRAILGLNPDRMSDREYDRMLKDFREKILGKGKAGAPPPPPPRGSTSRPTPQQETKSEAARIKEIYRLLVRRLHPDLRADKDVEVSHFWHEVQEAYGQNNLERLEMLLALTDLQANSSGDHTSVFQMRSVLSELKNAFKSLQKSLTLAKKDPAWNFARATDREALKSSMQRDLKRELANIEGYLTQLERRIAQWEAASKQKAKPMKAPAPPPKPAPNGNVKQPPKGRARPSYEQTAFGFD